MKPLLIISIFIIGASLAVFAQKMPSCPNMKIFVPDKKLKADEPIIFSLSQG